MPASLESFDILTPSKFDLVFPSFMSSTPDSSIRDNESKPEPMQLHSELNHEALVAPPAYNPDATTSTSSSTGPPPLGYSLASRKWYIIFFWTIVVFDSTIMPIALYYGLWYGTSLSPNTVFSIVTAAIGGISIFEYFIRFWRLFKKGSTCRVIGGRRKYLDWFHWCFTFMWVIIMIELIV